MKKGNGGQRSWMIAAPILAILAWTIVFPNIAVIAGSFENGLGHWREFMDSPADREALKTSIVISIASVIGSLLVGVPLAFLLSRFEFPGRRILRAVATLPAALPPLVGVIAFLFLYGESGVVTRGIQNALGMTEAPWRLTGVWAIIFVHTYTMYVYVFLFVSAGLERFDTTLDEAASGLGANGWQRLRRVTLPLLTPALAGSMLLVFMTSLGSFSAPYVFGGGIRVLSTQIVASKLNGSMGLAYVETTVLALSAVAGLLLFRWLEGKRKYTSSGKGSATRKVIGSRNAQVAAAVLSVITVVVLVLPHLMVVLVSFAVDGAWTTEVLPPAYTLDNYRRGAAVEADHEQHLDVVDCDRCQRDCLLRGRLSHRHEKVCRPACSRDHGCSSVGNSGDGNRARSRRDVQQKRSAFGTHSPRGDMVDSSARVFRARRSACLDGGRELAPTTRSFT